jgi:hypothetical protein
MARVDYPDQVRPGGSKKMGEVKARGMVKGGKAEMPKPHGKGTKHGKKMK